MKAKFCLGRVVGTPSALQALKENVMTLQDLLDRHVAGDRGELNQYGQHENEQSFTSSDWLLSVYRLMDGRIVWVITEDDQSSTVILLPYPS